VLLLGKAFLIKLFIDSEESVLQNDLTLRGFLDLSALGLWILIFVAHSELGDKELHIQLVIDLLTI
jgi:hypothetical protein